MDSDKQNISDNMVFRPQTISLTADGREIGSFVVNRQIPFHYNGGMGNKGEFLLDEVAPGDTARYLIGLRIPVNNVSNISTEQLGRGETLDLSGRTRPDHRRFNRITRVIILAGMVGVGYFIEQSIVHHHHHIDHPEHHSVKKHA